MKSVPAAVYLNQLGIVCALGHNQTAVRAGLYSNTPGGMTEDNQLLPDRHLQLGKVNTPLVSLQDLPLALRSRNNALLLTALTEIRAAVDEAIAHYGRNRLAIVLGTSTAGIGEAQQAIAERVHHGHLSRDFHLAQQELGSPAQVLATVLDLQGPAYVISTACSSGAKALASAARLLRMDLCDAVLCGGVDALSPFTVAGFSALESVSDSRCQPFSRHRQGINLGEGVGLFLMSKTPGPVQLLGWGETSDAHHISAPDPSGQGALSAMQLALARAGLSPTMIDYVNLHGTATRQNDAMESLAVNQLFGSQTPVSSTKPLTGHALGAAGAIEAGICWLSLHGNPEGRLPPHWWDGVRDPDLAPLNFTQPGQQLGRNLNYVLSNSFAFGGSNASLVLGRTGATHNSGHHD